MVTISLTTGMALGNDTIVFEPLRHRSALTAPTLTVTTSGTTVSLSWMSVTGATGYTLVYAPYPYTGPDSIRNIPMGTQTSMSASLWESAAFYVAIQAYNSIGSSGYSNIEHFSIWPLSANIDKMPEVYTAAVSQAVIDQYKQLLSPLPTEAKKWITGMGWGLEDLILDSNEIALLECLSSKNTSTILSILTKPTIIDGLTLSELTWARGYQVESLSEVLKDDIDELEKRELLSPEGLVGIQTLIGMAATDFEIAKGLHLIGNFGHPNADIFSYSVPSYNTQLYILGQLVELGIPVGYEVAAVAAALDYGTLWSIADNETRALIVNYALGMIEIQAETDLRIKQFGATWEARDLPLEGQITLIWGGPGDLYPAEYSEWERSPSGTVNINTGPLRSFMVAFKKNPMSLDDFEWIFITHKTKNDMRDYLINNNFLNSSTITNPDKLMEKIWLFYYKDDRNFIYIDDPGWPANPMHQIIDGRDVMPSYLANIEEQWRRFRSGEKFRGSSGDAYIGGYLIQALNMPNISMGYYNHTSGYFNPHSSVFRVTDAENTDVAGSVAKTKLLDIFGWWQIPWNNFKTTNGDDFRLWFTIPLIYTVGKTGVAPGYVYRANIAGICDLPNVCN